MLCVKVAGEEFFRGVPCNEIRVKNPSWRTGQFPAHNRSTMLVLMPWLAMWASLARISQAKSPWKRIWEYDVHAQHPNSEPQNRRGHGQGIFSDELFIFGGIGASRGLSDMWIFDLNQKIWRKIDQQDNGVADVSRARAGRPTALSD